MTARVGPRQRIMEIEEEYEADAAAVGHFLAVRNLARALADAEARAALDEGTPGGLDAAWAAAEAALPSGWVMWTVSPGGWRASARDWGVEREIHSWAASAVGPTAEAKGRGPDPTAALQALTAALGALRTEGGSS